MTSPSLDGVLVVDKPVGPTSHDVVARVRRACAGARVGHTGTLDPLASGVLPLVVGRATRLAQFLSASEKSYEATIRLGTETDTGDAEGEAVGAGGGGGALPRPREIACALDRFRGAFLQVPPSFSAKKVAGTRAYSLARRRRPVVLAPVPVTVRQLELLECEGDRVRVALTCSAGFYVRVLAHDLGRALGCGAHLAALRRTRSGEFSLAQAVRLDLADAGRDALAGALVPLDDMLPHLDAARLTERGAVRARHGQLLGETDIAAWIGERSPAMSAGRVRLFDPDGHLLAIAAREDNSSPLHPGIVLV